MRGRRKPAALPGGYSGPARYRGADGRGVSLRVTGLSGRLCRGGRVLRALGILDHRPVGGGNSGDRRTGPVAVLRAPGTSAVTGRGPDARDDSPDRRGDSGAPGGDLRRPRGAGGRGLLEQRVFRHQRRRLLRAERQNQSAAAHLVIGGGGAVLPVLAPADPAGAASVPVGAGAGAGGRGGRAVLTRGVLGMEHARWDVRVLPASGAGMGIWNRGAGCAAVWPPDCLACRFGLGWASGGRLIG